jgi:hypothetical protein
MHAQAGFDRIPSLTNCNITSRYLDDNKTGVVVCVIPANTENLRTSKAIRLMQTAARPSLQKSAIGVFAKSDMSCVMPPPPLRSGAPA